MLFEDIKNLDIGEVLKDEPLKNHTTFKIGGPADIFVKPKNEESIVKLLKFLKDKEKPYFILGRGSNLLVTDGGIRGVVICIYDALTEISLDGEDLYTGAGNTINAVSKFAQAHSMSNMERVSGIPGSIGGAIVMNAGAYGSEFKDFVTSVRVIDENLEIKEIPCEDMDFSYRHSAVMDKNYIVLGCHIKVIKKPQEEIDEVVDDVTFKRTSKQPLEMPSAGSTFKRPKDSYASLLIDQSGLKGFKHKGAMVSDKHTGFLVNHDNATYKDVIELIEIVKKVVYEKSGIELEPEVKIVGEDR